MNPLQVANEQHGPWPKFRYDKHLPKKPPVPKSKLMPRPPKTPPPKALTERMRRLQKTSKGAPIVVDDDHQAQWAQFVQFAGVLQLSFMVLSLYLPSKCSFLNIY